MPFPLPIDPTFRKEIITSWIQDCYDRLEMGSPSDAEISWKIANTIYLSLPPGTGNPLIEQALVDARVKLDRFASQS